MSDKPNGHRPIGRDNDYVTRAEVNARILGVDTRSAGIAANVEQLQAAALRDIAAVEDRAVDRDLRIERSLNFVDVGLSSRLEALEAKTLAGRIDRFKRWIERTWLSIELWIVELAITLDGGDETELLAAPVKPLSPAIAKLVESAVDEFEPRASAARRRVLWTGDPDCLPHDLRMGFHQGAITRIDKALPIRNESGEAGEVLCYVGDFITVDANGDLGVDPACEKCHQPSAGPGLAFEDGTICNEPAHVGSVDPHPPKPRLVVFHVPGPMSPPPPPKDRDFA